MVMMMVTMTTIRDEHEEEVFTGSNASDGDVDNSSGSSSISNHNDDTRKMMNLMETTAASTTAVTMMTDTTTNTATEILSVCLPNRGDDTSTWSMTTNNNCNNKNNKINALVSVAPAEEAICASAAVVAATAAGAADYDNALGASPTTTVTTATTASCCAMHRKRPCSLLLYDDDDDGHDNDEQQQQRKKKKSRLHSNYDDDNSNGNDNETPAAPALESPDGLALADEPNGVNNNDNCENKAVVASSIYCVSQGDADDLGSDASTSSGSSTASRASSIVPPSERDTYGCSDRVDTIRQTSWQLFLQHMPSWQLSSFPPEDAGSSSPPMSIEAMPCISAPLFASCLLPLKAATFPNRSSNANLLFRFLFRLVTVECAYLATAQFDVLPLLDGDNDDGIAPQQQPRPTKRRVHFAAFDCSSVSPPIDRVIDANTAAQQDAVTDALLQANETLQETNAIDRAIRMEFWEHMVRALQMTNGGVDDIEARERLADCAAAIHPHFPIVRVMKAASFYHAQFRGILQRLSDSQVQSTPFFVEMRLIDLLGQRIRYGLRMILNRPPPRFSPADHGYKDRSLKFSQVFTMISMKMPDDTICNVAVSDEFLSAIVSAALRCLAEYFGLAVMMGGIQDKQSNIADDYFPTDFCTHPACQQGFDLRHRRNFRLGDDQWGAIVADVHHATSYLAATRAAQFLCDLNRLPHNVHLEIQRCGGWSARVECHASRLWQLLQQQPLQPCHSNISKDDTESVTMIGSEAENMHLDSHLAALRDWSALQEWMRKVESRLEYNLNIAIDRLRGVANRFHLHVSYGRPGPVQNSSDLLPAVATSSSSRNRNHAIDGVADWATVRQVWNEGWHRAHQFPRIKSTIRKSSNTDDNDS